MARPKKKFHVHCKLDNASNLINGLVFASQDEGGVRTVDPVEADVAAQFSGIPGYSIVPAGATVPDAPDAPSPDAPSPDAPSPELLTPESDADEDVKTSDQADLLPIV